MEVICFAVPPLDGTVKISPWYEKAIVLPSGEIAGWRIHSGLS